MSTDKLITCEIVPSLSLPAAAIASRVSERLALSRLIIQGVENETVLESILSSSKAAENSGCFVQGAGECDCTNATAGTGASCVD